MNCVSTSNFFFWGIVFQPPNIISHPPNACFQTVDYISQSPTHNSQTTNFISQLVLNRFFHFWRVWHAISFANTYFALFPHTPFASIDSFWCLPDRGKFATELVRCNFLMIHVVLAKLTSNPLCFNAFSISAGWRPCLWRILIFFLIE